MSEFPFHYEEKIVVPAKPAVIFDFVDDHTNLSSHMDKASWVMGGGKMETVVDDKHGKSIGSHIKLSGKVFGIKLYLDEVVTLRQPPERKEWKTFGEIKLLVIGHYLMGVEIRQLNEKSELKVFIDYEYPKTFGSKILSYFFGGLYAKWCVRQMMKSVQAKFSNKSSS